uniref:Uncharacterized protein n=1 Tax=Podoviridae sp. ctlpi2 TaxID=2826574 RepID=A0A8S5MLP5_9CAUD|nr:MAG TPA: hypothetical protein [Podoviridae sp. ctlpi2]
MQHPPYPKHPSFFLTPHFSALLLSKSMDF